MLFADRVEAGRTLAQALNLFRDQSPTILGLPRGGAIVAAEVAKALGAPMDLALARKIGHPRSPEYAIGAVTEDGEVVLNPHETYGVPHDWLEDEIARQRQEAARRRDLYLKGRPRAKVAGRTAILVDDGIATGYTVLAAIRSLRKRGPTRIVVAAPVAPTDSVAMLKEEADEVVVLECPEPFYAIGSFYLDFLPVSDEEVCSVMAGRPLPPGAAEALSDEAILREVPIVDGHARLTGDLFVPKGALGIVVFAHGSGSSRHSLRNRQVAERLNKLGFGTLLFDLLTPIEDEVYERRFDIPLLSRRLSAAVRWVQDELETRHLPIALFGASTGAAAALSTAAEIGASVRAVVSRGGRPDLAWESLPNVACPTLLIVGEWDEDVLELNRKAYARLPTTIVKELEVVAGATHLFEEPGKIEEVSCLAAEWLAEHLVHPGRHREM